MVFQGYSFIANQYGEVVEEMNREEEGVRVHEFDLQEIDKERVSWGVFRDARDIIPLSISDRLALNS